MLRQRIDHLLQISLLRLPNFDQKSRFLLCWRPAHNRYKFCQHSKTSGTTHAPWCPSSLVSTFSYNTDFLCYNSLCYMINCASCFLEIFEFVKYVFVCAVLPVFCLHEFAYERSMFGVCQGTVLVGTVAKGHSESII